jgi:hypothetical protein
MRELSKIKNKDSFPDFLNACVSLLLDKINKIQILIIQMTYKILKIYLMIIRFINNKKIKRKNDKKFNIKQKINFIRLFLNYYLKYQFSRKKIINLM